MPGFRTLTINKGTRDGIAADMAVLAPGGVVGRVVVPSARSAKVQLLLDRNAAVGAIIDQTTFLRADAIGLRLDDFLVRSDSYSFFVALGDVITTGATETNVRDLRLLFAASG